MGDVRNRGTKERPLWYCRYVDIDGKRKHRPTHQPTKALAMRFVAEVEARVARGLVGIPELTDPERQGKALTLAALAERFLAEANPPTKDPKRYRLLSISCSAAALFTSRTATGRHPSRGSGGRCRCIRRWCPSCAAGSGAVRRGRSCSRWSLSAAGSSVWAQPTT